jgi:LPS-assembly lipoprotein
MILNPSRRSMLGWACIAAALSGCGFQPVYMPTASGKAGPAARELAAIDVGIIPDRPGQLLRQALQERFGSDAGLPQHYNLQISFWITGEGTAILSDTTATRIRLTGNANWTLVAQDPAKTHLTSGSARTLDGYNVLDQQFFAGDLNNEQVQKRIANAVADQVAMQLAIWFRQHAKPPTG